MSPEGAYRDIVRGYSVLPDSPIYVRHDNTEGFNLIQTEYDKAYKRATEELRLPTEKQETTRILSAGLWTDAKERTLASIDSDISRMELSKKKISHESQINPLYDAIEELRGKKADLWREKYSLFDHTAESYANHRARDYQIYNSCYREDLKEKYFSDPIEDIDFSRIYKKYNDLEINSNIIKKICVSHFFRNLFSISENIYYLFCKPFHELTVYQISLLRFSSTFSKVAEEAPDYSPEFEGNPEKILMWFYVRQNGGASREELEEEKKIQGDKFKALLNNPQFRNK